MSVNWYRSYTSTETSDVIPAQHPPLSPERIGILLVNSGTPDSTATRDVRKFLAGLLGDPRVVELPRWLWLPILHGIILRTRPFRSAGKYRKIWTPEGSPLAVHSGNLRDKLVDTLARFSIAPLQVETAMLYSTPTVPMALEKLRAAGARRLLVMPMFPQYSGVSSGAVFDQVTRHLQSWRWIPELRFIHGYHDHPAYISTLRHELARLWQERSRTEHLVFAYHGIPQKYFDRGDPYFCFCHKTSRLVAEELGLSESEWTVSFQSRFGPGRWLRPYTDEVLSSLPKRGIREITVISPGFAVDCLETLEELAIEGQQQFQTAGGLRYEYVPALNSTQAHASMLAELLRPHLGGWLTSAPSEQWERATLL